MKANIDLGRLYYNERMRNFFFREQSENTLEELIFRAKDDIDVVLDAIESWAEINNCDLDDFEEMLYNESIEEIARQLDLQIVEEDE